MERIRKCVSNCPGEEASLLELAAKAALAAGGILKTLYGKPHQVVHKGEIDLVTEADVAAEKAVLAVLAAGRPDIKILAEESPESHLQPFAGLNWIVDPLDGTTNFAHSFPWFAVSIGCVDEEGGLVGVIYAPIQDELFLACRGCGAWLNAAPIRVSATPVLDRALLATGFPYDVREHPEPVIRAMEAMLTRCQGVRRAGAAAMDLAYLACGRLDGFWEIKLKPWDTAAGQLLVEEAGGTVTDFKGGKYSPFLPEIAASNGAIHPELIALLAPFSEAV